MAASKKFKWVGLALAALAVLLPGSILAKEITVKQLDAHLVPAGNSQVIDLAIKTDIPIAENVEEALDNGIPLKFDYQVTLRHKRFLLWDTSSYQWSFSRRLSFFSLSSKYVVSGDRDNTAKAFSNLPDALAELNRPDPVPLQLPEHLHTFGNDDYIELEVGLDIESLPLPMRPLAYLSSSWRLRSSTVDTAIKE